MANYCLLKIKEKTKNISDASAEIGSGYVRVEGKIEDVQYTEVLFDDLSEKEANEELLKIKEEIAVYDDAIIEHDNLYATFKKADKKGSNRTRSYNSLEKWHEKTLEKFEKLKEMTFGTSYDHETIDHLKTLRDDLKAMYLIVPCTKIDLR